MRVIREGIPIEDRTIRGAKSTPIRDPTPRMTRRRTVSKPLTTRGTCSLMEWGRNFRMSRMRWKRSTTRPTWRSMHSMSSRARRPDVNTTRNCARTTTIPARMITGVRYRCQNAGTNRTRISALMPDVSRAGSSRQPTAWTVGARPRNGHPAMTAIHAPSTAAMPGWRVVATTCSMPSRAMMGICAPRTTSASMAPASVKPLTAIVRKTTAAVLKTATCAMERCSATPTCSARWTRRQW